MPKISQDSLGKYKSLSRKDRNKKINIKIYKFLANECEIIYDHMINQEYHQIETQWISSRIYF
jgi:hypothetical protein